MKLTNDDLLSLDAVCEYFGLSESTIRRKVRDSREGTGNFPLPLFKSGCRVLWKKSEIMSWNGEDAETITFTSSLIPPISQAAQPQNAAQALRGRSGKLPSKTGNELNN